jgi:N-acetylglucosaminyldiphosphoundecaprenol N-acetyl-beta-D-mannosaminyltransferase
VRSERFLVAGAALDIVERQDLLDEVDRRLRSPSRPLVIASFNLDHLTHFGDGRAHNDPALPASHADWIVTADGMPVVWWARRRARRPVPQLAGSDLLPSILEVAENLGARLAFVGGWPDQHTKLAEALAVRFPRLQVAGYWAPTKAELDDLDKQVELTRQIAASGAQVVVVGLGKPRQELWLASHLPKTGCEVGLAFGAAADFVGGTARRAPEYVRRLGLEWLYRLVREPRRLWRRYIVQGPAALWRLIRTPRR